MRVRLMRPDAAFDPDEPLPAYADELLRDLELGPILEAMARGDATIDRVARAAMLLGPRESLEAMRYRQAVLADCRARPAVIRDLYQQVGEALEQARRARFGRRARLPSVVSRNAVSQLTGFVAALKQLRDDLEARASAWASAGLGALLATLRQTLTDEAVAAMEAHLSDWRGSRTVVVSARLGAGNKAVDYRLRRPLRRDRSRLHRWLPGVGQRYRVTLGDDDERSRQALRQLREERLKPLSRTLSGTAAQVEAFLTQLHGELAFYVGCLNLEAALSAAQVPVEVPELRPAAAEAWRASGLRDAALALVTDSPVVANDLAADGCLTLVVTGANQGGKSTFLRSLGQAQLMAQAGLFVAAEHACLSACDGVLTHFPRPEDEQLRQGKLDEELARLSQCIDRLTHHGLLLSNESCAVTNQREGARILGDVAAAIHDYGARAVYVTHLHGLASSVRDWSSPATLLLRAERAADGTRRYRIGPGDPEPTSHGLDLYERILGGGG